MRSIYWWPISIAILTAAFFYFIMHGDGYKNGVDSLVGKPVPEVFFSTLKGNTLGPDKLKGRISLLVFFSSWCPTCHLMKSILKDLPLPVNGVLYRDPDFVAENFPVDINIFNELAVDNEGQKSILWGIRGVPEFFLIDADGVILWHHRGAITCEIFEEQVQPLLWKEYTQKDSPDGPSKTACIRS